MKPAIRVAHVTHERFTIVHTHMLKSGVLKRIAGGSAPQCH